MALTFAALSGALLISPDFSPNVAYAQDTSFGDRIADKEFGLKGGNAAPYGIWSDGTTIWVADNGDDKLYAYTLADGARVSETTGGTTTYPKDVDLDSGNGSPRGIWSDRTTIWVAQDNGFTDDKLYAYTLEGGARDEAKEFSLHSDNGAPRGIWSDRTTIWVGDAADFKLYAYSLELSTDATLSALSVSPVDIIGFRGDFNTPITWASPTP